MVWSGFHPALAILGIEIRVLRLKMCYICNNETANFFMYWGLMSDKHRWMPKQQCA
jgi:hypothetical protein